MNMKLKGEDPQKEEKSSSSGIQKLFRFIFRMRRRYLFLGIIIFLFLIGTLIGYTERSNYIDNIKVSPDGNYLAIINRYYYFNYNEYRLEVIDLNSNQLVISEIVLPYYRDIEWKNNKEIYLFTWASLGLFNIEDGSYQTIDTKGLSVFSSVNYVKWNEDKTLFVFVGSDGIGGIYDLVNQSITFFTPMILPEVAIYNDKIFLITIYDKHDRVGSLAVHYMENNSIISTNQYGVSAIEISHDGNFVAIGTRDGLYIKETNSNYEKGEEEFIRLEQAVTQVDRIMWSPDDSNILIDFIFHSTYEHKGMIYDKQEDTRVTFDFRVNGQYYYANDYAVIWSNTSDNLYFPFREQQGTTYLMKSSIPNGNAEIILEPTYVTKGYLNGGYNLILYTSIFGVIFGIPAYILYRIIRKLRRRRTSGELTELQGKKLQYKQRDSPSKFDTAKSYLKLKVTEIRTRKDILIMEMQCNACGTKNPNSSLFCTDCGTAF